MNNLNFLTATAARGSSFITVLIFLVIMIVFLWIPILNDPAKFKNKKTLRLACIVTVGGILFILLMQYIPTNVIMVLSIILSIGCIFFAPRTKKQQAKTKTDTAPAKSSPIESLTKLKDLLDSGAITREEFEEKKKQLLDL